MNSFYSCAFLTANRSLLFSPLFLSAVFAPTTTNADRLITHDGIVQRLLSFTMAASLSLGVTSPRLAHLVSLALNPLQVAIYSFILRFAEVGKDAHYIL